MKAWAFILLLSGAIAFEAAARAESTALLVDKSERKLFVFSGPRVARIYSVSLGKNPIGAKARRGDGRTPEGSYVIDAKNGSSKFHRALHISYPSPADRARSAAAGADPGGDIMIHGLRSGLGWVGPLHRIFDWTDGCIALTDAEMDELWKSVPIGTPIEIRP